MTHDTKATLPDASHDAYVRLMAAARRSEPHNGYGEADIVSDELTIRAHIAELEGKVSTLIKCVLQAQDAAIEIAAKNVQLEARIKDQGEVIALLRNRIQEGA